MNTILRWISRAVFVVTWLAVGYICFVIYSCYRYGDQGP